MLPCGIAIAPLNFKNDWYIKQSTETHLPLCPYAPAETAYKPNQTGQLSKTACVLGGGFQQPTIIINGIIPTKNFKKRYKP
eukprot:5826700-Amphidinium_carterae.1